MIFKGEFYVNKKKCAGECEIDDNNQIYLTIYNNSDRDGEKVIDNKWLDSFNITDI